MKKEWQKVNNLATEFGRQLGEPPQICMVLGSGLGWLANELENSITIETRKLHDFPKSTVQGHRGMIHSGTWLGTKVLVLQGRVHLYEGYSAREVARPLRAAIEWGIDSVFLTNAAGGIDSSLSPGRLMIIEDHINLTGTNPLLGQNNDDKGPRFPDMSNLYDQKLREYATEWSAQTGVAVAQGIYAGVLGPSYETPAEVRALRTLGASAVGMSTVIEAIAAKHLGATVFGVSCITNLAADLTETPLVHEEVERVGAAATRNLADLLGFLVGKAKGDR